MIVKFIGAVIFALGLWILYAFESASASESLHLLFWPAIALTFLSPIGLLLLSCDREQLIDTFHFLVFESLGRTRRLLDEEFQLLRSLGSQYYASGPRAFEVSGRELSPHIQRTLERLLIRVPLVDAYDLLERDRDQLAERFESSLSFLSLGGRLAPSVGMLGTIIGMSQLLAHLREPENIGNRMSVALLTTFYGLFFSLAIWTPLHHHLNRLLSLKMRSFDQALHWLELLQKRKPADYMMSTEAAHANSPRGAKTDLESSSAQTAPSQAYI